MTLRIGEESPVAISGIKAGYDALAECELQMSSNPFRDNLGTYEDRCRSLERELLEALDRRDWHAAAVLPNDCGAPDHRGRELRRLLRGGQVRASWWHRLWSWLRRGAHEEREATAQRCGHCDDGEPCTKDDQPPFRVWMGTTPPFSAAATREGGEVRPTAMPSQGRPVLK